MKSHSVGAVLVIATFGTTACVLPDVHDLGGGGGATASSSAVGSSSSAATTAASGSGAGGSDLVSAIASPMCTLGTDVKIQFVNFALSASAVDFCIGPVGGVGGPVGGEVNAPDGINYDEIMTYTYENATQPLIIRVVAHPGGCFGDILYETEPLPLVNGTCANNISVYYVADLNSSGKIFWLANKPADSNLFRLRFMNAVPGLQTLDFGYANSESMPANLISAFAGKVELGGVPSAGWKFNNVEVDDEGYLKLFGPLNNPQAKGWGAAFSGGMVGMAEPAVAVVPMSNPADGLGSALTYVAAGKQGNAIYPLKFYSVDELKDSIMPTTIAVATKPGNP